MDTDSDGQTEEGEMHRWMHGKNMTRHMDEENIQDVVKNDAKVFV